MGNAVEIAVVYYRSKVDAAFRRLFKEQAGAAELVATLVIVGIVLALALAFRNQLTGLVSKLWDDLVNQGDTSEKTSSDVTNPWTTGTGNQPK